VLRAAATCAVANPTSYSTTFAGSSENPLSEGGIWTTPADRTPFRRSGDGFAIGTQNPGPTHGSTTDPYDDSVMLVTLPGGAEWGDDQEAIITIALESGAANIQEWECIVLGNDDGEYVELNVAWNNAYSTLVWAKGTGNQLSDYEVMKDMGPISGGFSSGARFRLRVVGNVFSVHVDTGSGFVFHDSYTDTAGPGGGRRIATGRVGMGGFREADSGDMDKVKIAAFEGNSL
jgi:hypothetical protein